jgi:hypothetical protein
LNNKLFSIQQQQERMMMTADVRRTLASTGLHRADYHDDDDDDDDETV